jgi:hypothetical protein
MSIIVLVPPQMGLIKERRGFNLIVNRMSLKALLDMCMVR